jgi:EmrB/QacA subfamily drug resistance transporter
MSAATETAEAPTGPTALPKRRVLIILSALLLGMLLAALDQTIVSTALPTIVGDLGGATHLALVVTAYLLASTVSMPIWGKLGDLYGRKAFYQAAIVIFLVGSALSGFSHSMGELIAFRALQGLGGGGLMIGAQTIIGDIVSPRDRGRYMGLFGAVFGVTTVVGPLIGGLFVEYLSWRWVFYINLPIGIVALAVTATTLPGSLSRVHRVIDYLGTVLLVLGASALVMFTALGGTSFAWASPPSLALLISGVVLLGLFLWAETRADEPVIPLKLFRNRVFSAAGAIAFVVGFAMFGALTFLPLFLQDVLGVSPTDSGLRIFPVMFGLLLTSIISGQLVSRWGRYKVFPVVGTALMTVGLYLMSLIGVHTGGWVMAAYMFVFGVGLGFVMQVLVIAVQNAVDYKDLGVATSNNTFFRMMGACFGTAIFGAIFANSLTSKLAPLTRHLGPRHAFNPAGIDPHVMASLSSAARAFVDQAITSSVQLVFRVGVPIAAVAFILSWFLPEVRLRKSVQSVEPAEGFGMPEDRTSLQELQLALERISARENRAELYQTLAARAGVDLPPRAVWLLYRLADRPDCTLHQVAKALKLNDPSVIQPALESLCEAGLVAETPQEGAADELALTPEGQVVLARLAEARRAGLTELLEGWDTEAHPEVEEMIRRLAQELLADDEKLLADARPGVSV